LGNNTIYLKIYIANKQQYIRTYYNPPHHHHHHHQVVITLYGKEGYEISYSSGVILQ
jgi:hypothetical protein